MPPPAQKISIDDLASAFATIAPLMPPVAQPAAPPVAPPAAHTPAQASIDYVSRIRRAYECTLEYSDPRLHTLCLSRVPLSALRAEASSSLTPCPDESLTRALLRWFRADFFTWVDALPCSSCGGEGRLVGRVEPNMDERRFRASVVELHACGKCGSEVRFGRFNDARKLLETRRGRCGEWAQAFTAIAAAAGLEVRVAHDSTDHVWTEVWSEMHQRWLHADSCEAACDEPLLYEKGWGKKLEYVVAVGVGSVSDVTRRYTEKFDEVLGRRRVADEGWLSKEIGKLNAEAARALPVGERGRFVERDLREGRVLRGEKPVAGEKPLPGRQSGSRDWIRSRREGTGDD